MFIQMPTLSSGCGWMDDGDNMQALIIATSIEEKSTRYKVLPRFRTLYSCPRQIVIGCLLQYLLHRIRRFFLCCRSYMSISVQRETGGEVA